MAAQRHHVRRQVLELQVSGQAQAERLYPALSRLQDRQIVPLIDRICSQLSHPSRLDRIDRLELYLGKIDTRDLEEDFLVKLEGQLQTALKQAIEKEREGAEYSPQGGGDSSELELLTLFARTGTLPWWSDSRRSNLLDEAFLKLVERNPRQLARLFLELAREERPLRRIVPHLSDPALAALLRILSPLSDSSSQRLWQTLAELLQEAGLQLRAGTGSGGTALERRGLVWQGMLAGASLKSGTKPNLKSFIGEMILQVAARMGLGYASLVSSVHRSSAQAAAPEARDRRLVDTLETLERELSRGSRAESSANEAGVEAAHSGISAQESPQSKQAIPLEEQGLDTRRLLQRLQQGGGPLSRLATRMLPMERSLSRSASKRLLECLERLQQLCDEGNWQEDEALQWLADLLRGPIPGIPPEGMGALATLLQEALQNGEPAAPHQEPVDLTFSDADQIYIENSGLVMLWPFLRNFFERLGLVEEERFCSDAAPHRAAGLLQYLVSQAVSPPEYQLPLNKVLCGLDIEDVFDFGPPVTATEAAECDVLISAAIEHAPILKSMSAEGLRGTFLWRKGVLSSRDGAWLLRVERESYDLVLDRFPWSFEWIKLPWMKAALRVEW